MHDVMREILTIFSHGFTLNQMVFYELLSLGYYYPDIKEFPPPGGGKYIPRSTLITEGQKRKNSGLNRLALIQKVSGEIAARVQKRAVSYPRGVTCIEQTTTSPHSSNQTTLDGLLLLSPSRETRKRKGQQPSDGSPETLKKKNKKL